MNKFTKSDLRREVMATGSHFFDRSSMAFFGDSMANFGLRKSVVSSENADYSRIQVWELYRKCPVKQGLKSSHYFDINTFKQVIVAKG